jgi:hypothetical protein
VRYFSFVGSLLNNLTRDPQALIAALQGYYDQSHADKEFKRFTGVTPTSFRTTLNNIARMMHQSDTSQDSYNPPPRMTAIVLGDKHEDR